MSDTLDLGEEFMEHYGVKGMHWGIRNDKEDLSSLSDADLRARVNRIKLEQEYSKISNTSSVNKGLNFTKNHLGTFASITSSSVAVLAGTIKIARYLR